MRRSFPHMTAVTFIFVTAVILRDDRRDYKSNHFSLILRRMSSYLLFAPRWRKVWRDLSHNKTRTAIVVMSLAIGVFTVGLLINAESLLSAAFDRQFAAVNPVNATLVIPQGFDLNFLRMIRQMPEIEQADGLHDTTVRLKVGTNQWVNLQISAFPDFNDIRIDKVTPLTGAWPPADGEILFERSSLNLAVMPDLHIGNALTVQINNDKTATLKYAGTAYDFNRTPSPGTGIAYGYVSLETLKYLGEPTEMNELRIVVANNKLDKTYIQGVADQIQQRIENSGGTVSAVIVPNPGQHPLGTVLDALDIVLGSLSLLTLFGGALLVFNSITALLAQQVRQIGMMKAVGARPNQIAAMYRVMVLIIGLLALAIAMPLSILGGIQSAQLLGSQFNLDLKSVSIPFSAIAIQTLIGLGVPFLAALYPIWSGTRVTVREAISDYGLGAAESKPSSVLQFFERLHGRFFSRPLMLSLRNTFRRRLRLILTLLPLALSGAILITVINVRDALQKEFQTILAYRNYSVTIAFQNPYSLAKVESVARNVPGVVRIEGFHETNDAYPVYANLSQPINVTVSGVSPTTSMFHLPLLAGRWLTLQDQDSVVVNDSFLRNNPNIQLGDRVPFKINGKNVTLQVVGIVEEKMSPDGIYLNDSYYGKTFGGVGTIDSIWGATDPNQALDEVAPDLEKQLENAGLHVSSLTTVTDERDFIDFHFSIVIIPLGFAAVLLALVGGLGLMGTMSTNVLERQREIGVMRAIGASNGNVQWIVIAEGLFIGLISWLISLVAALPMTYVLDNQVGNQFLYVPLPFTFPLSSYLIWLLIVLVTTTASCYLPARNASQTSARELLSYE